MGKKRKTLSDKGVAGLKAKSGKRTAHPDPELRGHYIRVQPSGVKSFVAVALSPHGKQVWATIGACDAMEIEEARSRARSAIIRIKDGLEPFEAPPPEPNSVQTVAEQWLARHVRKKKLISGDELEKTLKRHVYPKWGKRDFLSIRRKDVAGLLDEIEDDHGPVAADAVLGIVRQIMNWQAARDDTYAPAIVKGMRRSSPKERARDRVLSDDELRAVWKAAEGGGKYGAFIRLCLLTGQRKAKVAAMRWKDIKADTWSVPLAGRQKGTGRDLVLPAMALQIIQDQTKIGDNQHVLPASRGKGPINSWSDDKADFDTKLKGVAHWTQHDLRRTAETLMARAGVGDVGDRVLGHTQRGVRGIYDRHDYKAEKADALRKLAALIDGIVHPRDNVVPMQRPAQ